MTITLTIDNIDSLPDGGPVRYQAHNHGFEIGREQHLDWTLPDPARYISGRHCEVRYENGGYWLYDVSSNGTFLNGAPNRVKSPYCLVDGDRLSIGHYIVRVELEGVQPAVAVPQPQPQPAAPVPPSPAAGQVQDIWDTGASAPPPADRRDFMPERPGRRAADFSQDFLDLPAMPRPSALREEAAVPESPFARQPAPEPAWPAGGGEGFAGAQAPAFAEQPPAPPQPVAAPAPRADALLRAVAAGAGVSPDAFHGRDPEEVAYEIGEVLKASVENLAQLLKARAAAKTMVKTSNRTMIGAADNNPLKFVPTAAEAIEIMFRRSRPGYLGARQSLEEGFADLKRHELATYAAMQKALARLLEDFTPETIEAKVAGSAFPLKKGRAWDAFVARWEEKSAHDNGMLDVFLAYFAEAYDEADRKKQG